MEMRNRLGSPLGGHGEDYSLLGEKMPIDGGCSGANSNWFTILDRLGCNIFINSGVRSMFADFLRGVFRRRKP